MIIVFFYCIIMYVYWNEDVKYKDTIFINREQWEFITETALRVGLMRQSE